MTTLVVLGTATDGTITGGRVDDGWATDVAAMIYTAVYGDQDSKRLRDEKMTKIRGWLIEGLTPGELADVEYLISEWREYDDSEGAR